MQCGTAPLALHEADFEDLAHVCLNLHRNELYVSIFMYEMAPENVSRPLENHPRYYWANSFIFLHFILHSYTLFRHCKILLLRAMAFSSEC